MTEKGSSCLEGCFITEPLKLVMHGWTDISPRDAWSDYELILLLTYLYRRQFCTVKCSKQMLKSIYLFYAL